MSRFERALLHLSTLVSTLTGLVYLVMKYLMKSEDPFTVLGHPWQPHFLAAHLLTGPVVIFALGLIAREHIVGLYIDPGVRRGRRSGMSLILLATPMVFSGYLLQIVTEPGPRKALVVTHVASGLLFALFFLGHLRFSLSRRRRENGDTQRNSHHARLVMQPAGGIKSLTWSRSTRGPRPEPGGRP